MKKSIIAPGLLACLLALTGPVEAFDATGTWKGKYKCQQKAGNVKSTIIADCD